MDKAELASLGWVRIMARAIWSGFLTFGLVSLPVGLYGATREKTLRLNQLHKGTANRIRYKKVDEVTGEEVSPEEIESGYRIGDGEYVVVSRGELRAMAPGRSQVIEIRDFVDLDRIDPMFFRQAYYLAPQNRGAERAYVLLRRALHETRKVGIAMFVLRDKEHLAVVRPGEEVLVLETMYFADEIREPRDELPELPGRSEPTVRELEAATQLIETLSSEWKPESYAQSYRDRVEELIEKKRSGHVVAVPSGPPRSRVVDLVTALEASLERTGGTSRGARRRHRSPARTVRVPPPAPVRLDTMSKAELVEQAAAIDLPGRSRMSKQELVDALTRAPLRQPGRRRQAS